MGRGASEGYMKCCVSIFKELASLCMSQPGSPAEPAPWNKEEVKCRAAVTHPPLPFPFRPRQQLEGRGVIAHPTPQCQLNQVKLKFQVPSRVWKKDRTTIAGTFCTAPLPVNDR